MGRKGIVKSIQSAQVEVAQMTRRFFSAPSVFKVFVPMILLSYFTSFVLFEFTDWNQAFYIGTLLFLVPTVLTALISKPLAEALGGRFNIRRSFLMSLFDLFFIFLFVLIYALFFEQVDQSSYFIFAFAATSWLRHVVLVSISNASHLRSLPISLTYPIIGFVMIAYLYPPFTYAQIYLAIVLLFIFILSASLFLVSANMPLKKAFGFNGLSMLRYFLDHGEDMKETVRVEQLMESFSSPISAHEGLISFKTKDGIKALMIVPSVHPGPFGHLGGSNLPMKLKQDLQPHAKAILVPHGPCTHDFNPPTTAECRKISYKTVELLKGMEYTNEVSIFERRQNHANVCIQSFGDSALVLVSLAPNPTDDLDFATGYAIRETVRECGYQDAVVIDAHNCLSPGSGMVHFGSKISMNIIETARMAAQDTFKHKTKGIRVGVAEIGNLNIGSMGPMGIQVLVLEVQGQKTAYILLDGNNLVPGFRGEIIRDISGLVEETEVLTTDNHVANITYGSFNPVGMDGKSEIARLTKDMVTQAVNDLEDAEVGLKTGIIEDFKVFGHGVATRLATLISTTVTNLRISAILSLLFAYSLSVLAVMLLI